MATPREQLAELLKQSRIDAGFASQGALARRLNVSRPVVSRAESATYPPPTGAILAAWAGVTGAPLGELNKLAEKVRSGGWFAGWAEDIEPHCSMIRWFQPMLVPGLTQTENYARAIVSWKPLAATAEANLRDRLARQSVLQRVELRVVILSSVLDREVGDSATMAEQIQHLLNVGSLPNVMLQVLPDTPAMAGGLGGAFAIATEGTTDTAAYTDSMIKGGVYTEPDVIARAVRLFDALRADAYSWSQTQEVLEERGNRWTL
jgi:transcriptional regulator with XRE-family HTH domain